VPPLLTARHVVKTFRTGGSLFTKKRVVEAVKNVDLTIGAGETLGVVGESGSGKSTLGRVLIRLIEADGGEVSFAGADFLAASTAKLRALRPQIQMIFQDPYASLNPRRKVGQIIADGMLAHGTKPSDAFARVRELLGLVGLDAGAMDRFPHEFSGGQRQRIGIARALAAEPDLIVCDEAVSALDVSVKAQIVNLLQDLQQELGLALLFISHDLAIVEHMTHRVAVMYLGKIVEIGPKRAIFAAPKHPYTEALLSAVPVPEPGAGRQRIILKGDVPSPINPPKGCRFHTRCPYAFDRCRVEEPRLQALGAGHRAACHLHDLGPAELPARAAGLLRAEASA
jgi:oligopeptide/dipeptide ABC transporter ATP-binding protein